MTKDRVRKPAEERCRQNLPVDAEVKSRRVYMIEPVDARCWAFMKLLRERCPRTDVGDVNPYAEVYPVRENTWAIFTENLDGGGDSWMYLIEGPEKAMLIDTGFGVGDLKALCRKLIGEKELIVVNTHSHYDHAYGNAQFDRVYIHENETGALQRQNEHSWDYLFQDDGLPIWFEFDRKDIIPWKPYEIIGVQDGYVWDLGDGYEMELIHLGGHTSGSSAILDRRGRNLFCGDDFVAMRVMLGTSMQGNIHEECATLSFFQRQVARLEQRKDEIDHLFPGHFIFDLGSEVIESMSMTLMDIMLQPNHLISRTETPRGIRFEREVPGLGSLAWREDRI